MEKLPGSAGRRTEGQAKYAEKLLLMKAVPGSVFISEALHVIEDMVHMSGHEEFSWMRD